MIARRRRDRPTAAESCTVRFSASTIFPPDPDRRASSPGRTDSFSSDSACPRPSARPPRSLDPRTYVRESVLRLGRYKRLCVRPSGRRRRLSVDCSSRYSQTMKSFAILLVASVASGKRRKQSAVVKTEECMRQRRIANSNTKSHVEFPYNF